jgi:hypothetical protein
MLFAGFIESSLPSRPALARHGRRFGKNPWEKLRKSRAETVSRKNSQTNRRIMNFRKAMERRKGRNLRLCLRQESLLFT